ncbi:hypothetical protein HanXRQr2_Chr09g0381071 [Helianthus annuus]|uniref:Uncharacterized protein n=1 Tax=Helianthus annuus TaxID=4232 RepID=A0A9K3I4R5_HELAN|nr:hypothetical protein HanXRQr2_Chr09g0381071 [Helianthus annuus]KAJ0710978.1 hypothetical protein HanOQP8_Chr09g0318661 [Helianthus annuus]KAJ0892552.1 hypothetical protein HanPSC8_Chr09g0367231 [Helianthus annuus]
MVLDSSPYLYVCLDARFLKLQQDYESAQIPLLSMQKTLKQAPLFISIFTENVTFNKHVR